MFGDPPIRIQRARQLINDTHRSNRVCSSSALGLGGATLNLLLTATSPEAAAHIHRRRRRRDANLLRGVVTSLLMPRVHHWNRIAAEGMAPPTLTAVCPGHRVTSTKAPPPSPTPPTPHIPFVNLSDSDTKHSGVTSTCCLRPPPPPPSLPHSWQLRIVGKNVCWAHSEPTNQSQSAADVNCSATEKLCEFLPCAVMERRSCDTL